VKAFEVVAILAGGPSLRPEHVLQLRAAGVPAIAVNDSWELMPDAAALFAGDAAWWAENPQAVAEFKGERFVCQDQRVPFARYYAPRYVTGGNSALHAACLAQDFGARLVLLLGVDLNESELTHWHGQHREPLINPTPGTFRAARGAWQRFADDPGRPEVINCNPASSLLCFPRLPLDQALKAAASLRSAATV
jgi:hypothetical protein